MSALLICVGMAVTSAIVSGILAWAWAKKHGWVGYVISTAAVWIGISTLPLFTPSWQIPAFPVDFAHFLANLIAIAPLALLPFVVLVRLVLKGSNAREIIITSSVTSIIAVPLCFFSGVVASCSVLGDCL